MKVRIWDLPTRLFHWSMVLCFVGMIITGEVAGNAMVWHFRLGYALLALVLFRLVWGLVGGHWSRFSSFVRSPAAILRYVKGAPEQSPGAGHNPLGALSVLALLLFMLLQIGAGLCSDDEVMYSGPLVNKISAAWVQSATFIHTEVVKVVLIVLVILHLAAIAWYRIKKKEDLVGPMVHGDKQLAAATTPSRDNAQSRLLALVCFGLCCGAVAALLQWARPGAWW